jgi:hypothetical protein
MRLARATAEADALLDEAEAQTLSTRAARGPIPVELSHLPHRQDGGAYDAQPKHEPEDHLASATRHPRHFPCSLLFDVAPSPS